MASWFMESYVLELCLDWVNSWIRHWLPGSLMVTERLQEVTAGCLLIFSIKPRYKNGTNVFI